MSFGGARAGLRSPRPGVAAIFAEQPSDQHDRRKHYALNSQRDGSKALCAPVPVHDVRDMKQGHAAGLARVGNCENGLQVAINIGDRNNAAFELERLIVGIPPAVRHTHGKNGVLAGGELDGFAAHDRAQNAGDDFTFLALYQVNMQRWTFPFGREAAFDFEDDLIAAANAPHDEDFSRVAVFQAKCAPSGTCKVKLL